MQKELEEIKDCAHHEQVENEGSVAVVDSQQSVVVARMGRILMERLMHFIMLDHDEQVKAYRDDLNDDIGCHIEICVWMWNHLRISMAAAKFHLVKDHLVDCFKKWGSLGQYNEEFIEADHVRGNSKIRTYAALLRTPQHLNIAMPYQRTLRELAIL